MMGGDVSQLPFSFFQGLPSQKLRLHSQVASGLVYLPTFYHTNQPNVGEHTISMGP